MICFKVFLSACWSVWFFGISNKKNWYGKIWAHLRFECYFWFLTQVRLVFFYFTFSFLCIIFFCKESRRYFELQVIFWGSFPYSGCFPTKSFFQLTVAGLTGVLGVHALLPVAVELKHEIAAAPTPLLPMVVRNALDLTQRPSNAKLWFVRVSTTAARA